MYVVDGWSMRESVENLENGNATAIGTAALKEAIGQRGSSGNLARL
jgi:hypothetical protein